MAATTREPATSSETVDAGTVEAKSRKRKVEPLVFSDEDIEGLAQVFQNRAGDANRTANLGLAVTIVIGFLILSLFAFSVVLSPVRTSLEQPANPLTHMTDAASTFIVRIGAVLIGIFVIQVLIGFVRYNTKMYFHWAMCSALVRLSRGNHLVIKDIASTLLPSSIDFGKMPSSPVEKVFDGMQGTLKELVKKIPNRV